MTVVYDAARARLTLGPELKRGGEGTVYLVEGRSDLLAKIYHPGASPGEAKLTWMRDHPPLDPTRAMGHISIAWPRDLLYDGRGAFVGFGMPRVRNAAALFDVFNPTRRARVLPGFDRRYLHRAARNLASAVGAVHARDYVVGDLNEGNVLVTPTALVSLIDTDSFQVRARSGRTGARPVVYPCPVGKAEYTPPELQGQTFGHLVREPEHDRFALAVLIFQLLLEGNHPFRARWLGDGEPPSLEAKIRRGYFPHAKPAPGPIAPPANAPALDVVHPAVAHLIRACFVDGHRRPPRRPEAADWELALEEAERALRQCANGHYFSTHRRTCPWCPTRRTESRTPRVATRRPAVEHRPPATVQPATSGGTRRVGWAAVRRRGGQVASLALIAVAVWTLAVNGDLAAIVRDAPQAINNGRLATLPTSEAGPRRPGLNADVTSGCWTRAQRRSDELPARRWSAPPAMVIDPERRYTATLQTNYGVIGVELLPKEAPLAVNNFVCLAGTGYFDGTLFHRVVAWYLMQGGDPANTMTGGPGYTFANEPVTRPYERGTVAMVSQGLDTNGSQFFITLADLSDELPPEYTIFGRVTRGQAVLDRISEVPKTIGPGDEISVPLVPVVLERVTVAEG